MKVKSKTPSPVVTADSKFFGTAKFLCVDVLFHDREELKALIDLRDSKGLEPDHVHLQDRRAGRQGWGAEVTFHRPRLRGRALDKELVLDAHKWLTKACNDATKTIII